MANSSIINEIKDKVINELINDGMIVKAIGNKDIEYPDDLINQNIFRYNKNPNTIQSAQTYITVQVDIPTVHGLNKKWVKPILQICIISHNNHMNITDIKNITADRNDFLSQLIDEKFNGRNDFGFGQIFLERNVEGNHPDNNDYLFRQMIFEGTDLNNPVCR